MRRIVDHLAIVFRGIERWPESRASNIVRCDQVDRALEIAKRAGRCVGDIDLLARVFPRVEGRRIRAPTILLAILPRLTIFSTQRGQDGRVGLDIIGLQQASFDRHAGRNEELDHFLLTTVIPCRRVGPTMNRPTKRR